MAEQPVTARAMREFSLTVGSDSYSKHSDEWSITNDSKAVIWKGGTPDAIVTDTSPGTHMLNLAVVHDYENPDGLYVFLIENEGDQVTFVLKPSAAGDFQATVTATVIAPTIGGKVDAFGRSVLALPCTKPVLVLPS